ncbi:MAG: class I adenylate-forming enzyme family protein [Hyphomonadaceae bacterium]|nr:class I adenylate-forming enzyme family protein [Hyphomonadaceae bacterium]
MTNGAADPPSSQGTRPAGHGDDGIDRGPRNVPLGDLLREAALESGERVALVDGVADPALRRRWTYSELLVQAEQVARGLLARFQPGAHIAVCAPNSVEWVILEYGAALAGMVLVPANPAYRQSELTAILQDSAASAVFYADSWRSNDIAATVAAVHETALPDLALLSFSQWDEFLASGATTIPLPKVHPRDPVLIQFTSGTTGRPKGAILHHGFSNPPRSCANCCDFRQYGTWLNSMPMYHIGGAAVSLLATLSRHGVFVQMREWDPALALELIESESCNAMLLVPTMVADLLEQPDFVKHDVSSIDFILTGGTPVAPALLERVTKQIGCPLLISFGLTESGGPVSNTAIGDGAHELATTLGRALPNVQVEVRDPETTANLPIGVVGEMWVKSSQIMLGYYGGEKATQDAITPDGWLRTGDLAMLDERGYISIRGRLKDMIIRGGENIYPLEVEHVLVDHPSVSQAAVVGFPNDKWGEIVLAVVQIAEGQALNFEQLDRHCRERLASYKVPVLWCEIDRFRLNSIGKIQKSELADYVRDGNLKAVSLHAGEPGQRRAV